MRTSDGTGPDAPGPAPVGDADDCAAPATGPPPWHALDRHFEEVPAIRLENLEDLMADAGTDVAMLARRLDIDAEVLDAIVVGVVPGLPKPRLVRALAYELSVSYEAVARAVMSSAASFEHGLDGHRRRATPTDGTRSRRPRGGAGKPIQSRPKTFVELVERTSMSRGQKAYWLGDD